MTLFERSFLPISRMLLFLFFAVSAAEIPAGPVPIIQISYLSI